jgi:hypothetical protein
MKTDEWIQDFVIVHNSMFSKKDTFALAQEMQSRLKVLSDGFWKPQTVTITDLEIRIKCKYVEGELTNEKQQEKQ